MTTEMKAEARKEWRWYEKVILALYKYSHRKEIAERERRFQQRMREDPRREYHVQKVGLIILKHPDEEEAALQIVDYFLPRQ